MLSNEYIAGLFDGEGCVWISKSTRKTHKCYDYTLRACIANQNTQVLELVKERFGGYINKSNKWCSQLVFAGNIAKPFLEAVLPFAVIKKEQVIVGLDFLNGKLRNFYQKGGLPEAEAEWRELHREKIKFLNSKFNHHVQSNLVEAWT